MYKWVARYGEDQYLPQTTYECGQHGKGSPLCMAQNCTIHPVENRYEAIDRDRLTEFQLLGEAGNLVLSVRVGAGDQLIFRRRNFLKDTGESVVFYLAGVTSHGHLRMNIVTEVGQVLSFGEWDDFHPLFYPVELIPEEIAAGVAI